LKGQPGNALIYGKTVYKGMKFKVPCQHR